MRYFIKYGHMLKTEYLITYRSREEIYEIKAAHKETA